MAHVAEAALPCLHCSSCRMQQRHAGVCCWLPCNSIALSSVCPLKAALKIPGCSTCPKWILPPAPLPSPRPSLKQLEHCQLHSQPEHLQHSDRRLRP